MIVFAVLVGACSSPASHQHATASVSEDARFWGRTDVISAADRQSILATAGARLTTLAPSCHIQNIKVFSAREVRVFFAPDSDTPPGDMGLERSGKAWHMTDEQPPRT
jgi:hypothetical protein